MNDRKRKNNGKHIQIASADQSSGWYQEKCKPAQRVSKGDVVRIPSGTGHWHGASKDSSMPHLAITNSRDGGVKWLQPVTDEEYGK